MPGSRPASVTAQRVLVPSLRPRGWATFTLEHTGEEAESAQQGALSPSRESCAPSAQASRSCRRPPLPSLGREPCTLGAGGQKARGQPCLPSAAPTAWAPAQGSCGGTWGPPVSCPPALTAFPWPPRLDVKPPSSKSVIQRLTWCSHTFERINRLLANACALFRISVTDCDRKSKIIAA